MMFKQVLAVCLPLLLVSVGVSQAFASPGEAQRAVVEVRTGDGEHRIPMSLEAATVIDVLLQDLTAAIHAGDRDMIQRVLQQLSRYGIDIDLPSGLLDTDATPISNRLCIMYGYFSKALFSYPLDLAVAGILSLFNGFATIGLFLLWSVLTHALHPVHLVAPLIFMTVIDGSVGQLVTRGLDGRQVISADELSTHVILGFVGTIINIIVPVQGAPDPAFCVGAALTVTP
ncbi:MAG: hypothetical protein ACP5FL_08485, partial [Thermoplasmatota archaeon]